ncbi:MAG: tetratricopeptide repeat protein [Sulfuricurvum sp.]
MRILLIQKIFMIVLLLMMCSINMSAAWNVREETNEDKTILTEAKSLTKELRSDCWRYDNCLYAETAFYNTFDLVVLLKKGDKNDAFDLVNIGGMYYNAQKYEKAFHYFLEASLKHSTGAKYNLGYFYCQGIAVQKDPQKAFEYFTKASDEGDAKATYQIGLMYAAGEIGNGDKKVAIHYLLDAGKNGDRNAMRKLSQMFSRGDGVAQNDVMAYAILKYLAGNNSEYAIYDRSRLVQRMTDTQYREAIKLSKNINDILELAGGI